MTRRDFRMLATAIHNSKLVNLSKIAIAEDLADAIEKGHPNFKREAFLEWALHGEPK